MKAKLTLAVIAGAISLSACAPMEEMDLLFKPETSSMTKSTAIPTKAPEPLERNNVNAGKSNNMLAGLVEVDTPSLDDLLEKVAPNNETTSETATEEDKLRYPAIKDTALSYGAQGGLAYTSKQINKKLKSRSKELDVIYDFKKLMVRGPDGVMVLPPVISEAKDAYEITEAGKGLRVADQVYEIIEQAKFSPVAPLWHSYLIRDYSAPIEPPSLILPKNDEERKIWKKYISEGWEAGTMQAEEIFQADLYLLNRDYQGMVKYRKLLAEGKVSAPIVSKGSLGVTGTGEDMRVNDRTIRIMKDPQLVVDPYDWSPTVNSLPSASVKPSGSTKITNYPRPVVRRY